MTIEKKIHYCWFGYGEKNESINKCIESWRKHLQDYEIIEWNESNFDINICNYVKEAYNEKKYAFVSDYVRFYVLYSYGGIYLDVDVEVLKPLDIFLDNDCFAGFENINSVAPGLIFGAKKENKIVKEILDSYSNKRFIVNYGGINLTTVVKYTTDILLKHGLKLDNKLQNVAGIMIYPKTYFCPLTNNSKKTDFTEDTYTIHHFAGTWLTDKQKRRNKSKIWKIMVVVFVLIKWPIVKLFGERRYETLKVKIRRVIKLYD